MSNSYQNQDSNPEPLKLNSLIGGEWVTSEDVSNVYSPADLDQVVAVCSTVSAGQVDAAVRAGQAAFEANRKLGTQARADSLEFVAAELFRRKEELGILLAREEGKTLPEAVGEVMRAAYIFRFFAAEAIRIGGELGDSVRPGVRVEVMREPIGVVGIITPWNFPIAIPAWKIAPALAYGNSVVMKPAELAPASSHALAEVISRSGLPAGTFNLVLGSGSKVGQRLVEHPDVCAVSFTGSQQVGAGIAAACVARGAKYQLEMGGKNPLVVLDDADVAVAVEAAVNGAYFSTGQRCTASSRLIVTKGIHDEFVTKTIDRLKGLVVGDPLDAATAIGPVVDERQYRKNVEYVEIGQKEGCELAFGGGRVPGYEKGFFQIPALLVNASNQMRVSTEEIFGPVASVIKVDDYDAAVATANDTEFGLSAGICTQSHRFATDFKRQSQSGLVMVNLPTAGLDYHVPFGGVGASSYGAREQGVHAREFYTRTKTVYDLA
jgi:acyl-CoA reductase-like NAD-dependent aldehyde dehydrogenase